MTDKYIVHTKDGIELKDYEIIKALEEAKKLYEDGAIVETADILIDIINSIQLFDLRP